ncbi:MAG: UvrD-helicase domain-containing protein [Moraxella sp.]|nr:UvrD-helicase domain-containing protein [Moraxella sp.]
MNDLVKLEVPAAVACPLSGAFLIEASAGTGKTWTLTGILLRLLIEKGVRPERMLATTFTRAAAAEMQERLFERLMAFYDVCHYLKLHAETLYGLWREEQLAHLQNAAHQLKALADPINEQLSLWLLAGSPRLLDKTLYKVRVLIATVDKLFIGTLDSLAQKWLREFSHEIGEGQKKDILTDVSAEVAVIIHDELRAAHISLAKNSPKLYAKVSTGELANVTAASRCISNALQFYTAPIDELPLLDDGYFSVLEEQLFGLLGEDWSVFEPYFSADFRKSVGMNSRLNLVNLLSEMPTILQMLKEGGVTAFEDLSDKAYKLFKEFLNKDLADCFNKNRDAEKALWLSLPLERFVLLARLSEVYHTAGEAYIRSLMAHIAKVVREKLPQALDKKGKTSFSLTMLSLERALSGRQGELLARHIRHLYPVALIDESQDINGEQARLLKKIYLSDDAKKTLFSETGRGFLLFVGDPKQAIYRFRGGDVANYNAMKASGLDTRFSLSVNRRSQKSLITALNAWFCETDTAFSSLGEGIFYYPIQAAKDSEHLTWQDTAVLGERSLSFLRLKSDSHADELTAAAQHINHLLKTLYIEDKATPEGKRLVTPADVAVLVADNSQVLAMQEALARYDIPSAAANGTGIYQSEACHDIYALLSAVITPSADRLGRLLTSLFRFDLAMANAILEDDEQRATLMAYLKNLATLWQNDKRSQGVSFILGEAFLKPPFLMTSLWAYLAGFEDGLRYLSDVWQLFELLSEEKGQPSEILASLSIKMGQDFETKVLPLPATSAVSVMTMHKSKGLEFPIVYVLELDKNRDYSDKKLFAYTENHQRRLSAVAHQGSDVDFFIKLDKKESLDEKKRVAYVALTRAAEKMFVLLKDRAKASLKNPSLLDVWGFMPDKKTYALPERLVGHADWLEFEGMAETLITTPYQGDGKEKYRVHYRPWQEIYPVASFYGQARTSFSALARRFNAAGILWKKDESVFEFMPVTDETPESKTIDDETLKTDDDKVETDSLSLMDIRSGFMRGTVAGTFLHEIFEQVDTTAVKNSPALLKKDIEKLAKKHALLFDEVTLQALTVWLYDAMKTPFLASGVCFLDLDTSNKHSELSFMLSLKNPLDLERLNVVFGAYSGKDLPIFETHSKEILAYLKGEIDLLYEHDGRYYVVDFKSNFITEDTKGYTQAAMAEVMNHHNYWLQAAIYQVALHRLLKLRIPNYAGNEKAYLGACEYVFLRGVKEGEKTGRLVWDVPLALVLALDELFG